LPCSHHRPAVQLSDEHHKRLDNASAIALGDPSDFLRRREVRDFLHGGTRDSIDA
jgi:hypothetical protein